MAALRLFKGSVLEENICRTAGSIGESVAGLGLTKAGSSVLTLNGTSAFAARKTR